LKRERMTGFSKKGALPKQWYPLLDKDGDGTESRGEIELDFKFMHNPARIKEKKKTTGIIFKKTVEDDPRPTKLKTTVKKKNLKPVWKEIFDLKCNQDNDAQLEVILADYDLASGNDFMGKVIIPIKPLAHLRPVRQWYTLGDETGLPDGVNMRGQVELVLRWFHNPDTPEAREARRLVEEAEAERRRYEEELARLAAEEAARDPRAVERRTLDELYEHTQHSAHAGDGWKKHKNWTGKAAEEGENGERYGVTTTMVEHPTKGKMKLVTQLDLSMNHLSGEIPMTIGKFKFLQYLGLSNNDLYGEIPEEISSLEELIILSMRSNHLSGEIPPCIGSLSKLRYIGLSDNEFVGAVPAEIGQLKHLVELKLDNNALDHVPDEIINCSALEHLDLSYNCLPDLPDLTAMTKLRHLYLQNNELEGGIPEFPYTVSQLDLSENHLSGMIPRSLGNLLELNYLNLVGNSFSLPEEADRPDHEMCISNNPVKIYDEIREFFLALGFNV